MRLPARLSGEILADRPDALDETGQYVVGAKEAWRHPAVSDASGRAREDEVARVNRADSGDELHQLRDRENHLARARVLHDLAVQRAGQGEVILVGKLVRSNQGGACRAEA